MSTLQSEVQDREKVMDEADTEHQSALDSLNQQLSQHQENLESSSVQVASLEKRLKEKEKKS